MEEPIVLVICGHIIVIAFTMAFVVRIGYFIKETIKGNI